MRRFRAEANRPLDFDFDPEARLAAYPTSHTIKGMFLMPLVEALGPDLERIAPTLRHAPPGGKFIPFRNYPQSDCARMAFAVARKMWPRQSLTEACRRLGRRDIENFRQSTVGRVTLSLLGDPESTLLKLPEVYKLVLTGGTCSAERLTGGGVRVEYKDFGGTLDNLQIGTVEGIVLNYGKDPTVEVAMAAEDHAVFEITWR